MPLPAVGSRTVSPPVTLPFSATNMSATKLMGSGVEYCCILMRLLLRWLIVGCMSYRRHICSNSSFWKKLLPRLNTALRLAFSASSRPTRVSASSTSSWIRMSSRPSLSTFMPHSAASLRKSTILRNGFSPLVSADRIRLATSFEKALSTRVLWCKVTSSSEFSSVLTWIFSGDSVTLSADDELGVRLERPPASFESSEGSMRIRPPSRSACLFIVSSDSSRR